MSKNKSCECLNCTCTIDNDCGCFQPNGVCTCSMHLDTRCNERNVPKFVPTFVKEGPKIIQDPIDPLNIIKPVNNFRKLTPKGDPPISGIDGPEID